ncbi:MAG: hypothetical protein IPJ74_23140 [Saprospiraceae bacterium]|nr:hypothetical protein [Saprospiraceae bacterium]
MLANIGYGISFYIFSAISSYSLLILLSSLPKKPSLSNLDEPFFEDKSKDEEYQNKYPGYNTRYEQELIHLGRGFEAKILNKLYVSLYK